MKEQLDREISYFENYNLTDVVTPVNIGKFRDLLRASSYNEKETQFLEDGFQNGFSLEYDGPTRV